MNMEEQRNIPSSDDQELQRSGPVELHENGEVQEKEKEYRDSINESEVAGNDTSCDIKEEMNSDLVSDRQRNDKKSEDREQPSTEKKAKTTPKQTLKGKLAVSEPSALNTERKTLRERKTIVQQSNPKLSESPSLRSDPQRSLQTIQTQNSLRLEKATELKKEAAKSIQSLQKVFRTRTSIKGQKSVKVISHGVSKSADSEVIEQQNKSVIQMKDKDQNEQLQLWRSSVSSKTKPTNQVKAKDQETEAKKSSLNSNTKHNVEDLEIKLKKSATFKATPLPSFYSKRSASIKAENKEKEEEKEKNKLQKTTTFKASPLPSFYKKRNTINGSPDLPKSPQKMESPTVNIRGKSLSRTESKRMEEKRNTVNESPDLPKSPQKTELQTVNIRSKSLSRIESKKMEEKKKTAEIISNSTRETIKRLLKVPWKSQINKNAESKNANQAVLDNKGTKNEGVSTINGNNVAIAVRCMS